MRALLGFVALFCQASAVAADWRIGTTYFKSVEDPSTGWSLSPGCNSRCEAWVAAKSAAKFALSKEKRAGGKNPGSVLCHEFKGASVIVAVDAAGNQQSFCVFPDKSFISTASLIEARQPGGVGR